MTSTIHGVDKEVRPLNVRARGSFAAACVARPNAKWQHRPMRSLCQIASLFGLGLLFATHIVGCGGFDCASECENVAVLLAANGRNPETGTVGGMREDEVCTHARIVGAQDCRQCVDAMVEIYRFFHPEVGCDCPPENPTEEEEAYPVVAFDDQCVQRTYPYNVEGCAAFANQPEDLEQCF